MVNSNWVFGWQQRSTGNNGGNGLPLTVEQGTEKSTGPNFTDWYRREYFGLLTLIFVALSYMVSRVYR
jgi:hypothetical protein